jgi:hypothetical protein
MATIFNDLNMALQHVVMHAELSSVKRLDKTCEFKDYEDYHILLALLTETGVTPEAKTFFENFSLKKGKQDNVVRNYLYATGTFHTQNGIQSGDLFLARKSSVDAKTLMGLVLKVDEKGQISSYISLENKQYEKQLILVQDSIQPELIYEAFSLKMPMESLPVNSPYLKFYGKFYDELLRRRGEYILGYPYILGSTKGELLIFNKDHFFKFLALGAPLRITKLFFLIGSDVAEALKVCATLGKGLQVFTPKTNLQAGTLLFTKEIGVSVLVGSNASDKVMPALVPGGGKGGYLIEWIKPEMITHFWEPSIDTFEYVKTNTNPAFKDINRLLGNLYCLSGTFYSLSSNITAIFGKSLVLDSEIWHPDIYAILKGFDPYNDNELWMGYLAKKGNGFLNENEIPQVGDFLFVEIDKRMGSAIVLNDGQMIVASYTYRTIPIMKITGVKKIWRPSLTATKS